MLKVRKVTEERKAPREIKALWGQKEIQAPALVQVSPLNLENEDRRVIRAQKVVQALDTLAIKVNVGLQDFQGPLVLQGLQLRWSDSEMGLLCSR